ncbi:MAG: S26 family signal peptidase [Rudaea sp.]|uniref:S26 family signal peptidase n=1 Tax=unclassified Rudaea TaxID=2627037 RepID=UPI0010F73D6E|nr:MULTISPECIES: S26 family signal peptidase [unclassified Rudaea]MBN8888445.1 S26 family signal peptidase [Rudaea sp.]MBR0347520.1 S26 family signal peptidase [Rudaea sp.]
MRRVVVARALRYYAMAVGLVAAAFAADEAIDASGHALVVNTSPSMPSGIYWIARGGASMQRGDVVQFAPPDGVRELIYGRGWLPEGMPLLKTVGGLAGDVYCVRDGRFVVADADLGPVFTHDSQDLPVPQILGCRCVGEDEFLPVASTLDRSFDGRYFGAVPVRNVLGVGHALVTF